METQTQLVMTDVFISGDSIISPLGIGSELNFEQIKNGISGIKKHQNNFSQNHFFAGIISDELINLNEIKNAENFTRLEQLIILSLQNLIQQNEIPLDEKTLIVLSTTKGNISHLHNPDSKFDKERTYLTSLTRQIENYFNLKNKIFIVSNACISGSLAIEIARRQLQSETYERAIVIGADEVSKFILSGFESFQAVSDSICKPFDKDRNGISLGEAVASVYLTKSAENSSVKILGSGTYNDANHISGPSRTAEGLYKSIQSAMNEAKLEKVNYISAHGTATIYNDEMEAIAFHRANLSEIPTNSLKGYFGHTLGASGLLETILGIHSLKNNTLIPSFGFDEQGTTQSVNIIKNIQQKELKNFLKTASGFGGSNIATVFEKV